MGGRRVTRRALLRRGLTWGTLLGLGAMWLRGKQLMTHLVEAAQETLPTRPLGATGLYPTIIGLGGEGILRTTGRMKEAVPVIRRALELGITYFDTAPAYQQSQDYLGEALGGDEGDRPKIILASKTHERTRDGSLTLLENSLKRLRTDHLDVWQLHDLRSVEDLDELFARDGAIHAVEQAKAQGLIRFVGITGHYDPDVLVEGLKRYPFDTVMCSLNVADPHRLPFQTSIVPEANQRGAGLIAMKVLAHGLLPQRAPALVTTAKAIHYVLSLPVSTIIIGCRTPQEVEENVRIGGAFAPLSHQEMRRLEREVEPLAWQFSSFKRG
ncbi:MAG: aldo/keto reductase [Candidatus Omnitrophica bacterium]|nr:aldo/keto reductase [Candidatus Omnitrophota bacterium]